MKSLILTLVLGFSAVVFAEGSASNSSQFQHQTAAGIFEITPELVYLSANIKSDSVKKAESDIAEGLVAEYGLSPMLSLGLAATLADDKLHSDNGAKDVKSSGLGDLDLFLNGRAPTASGSFRFGAHVFISPDSQKKVDTAGDLNAASGGETLTPFVGYEFTSDRMTYGARVKYDVYKTKAKFREEDTSPIATGKMKDGNELKTSVFAEADLNPVTLGASFSVVNEKKAVLELDPNPSFSSTAEYSPATSRWELNLYAAYTPETWVTILPTIGYADWTAVPKDIGSQNAYFVSVAARFAF